MSLLVVGLSHRTAPVALLERVSVSGDALAKLLHDVQRSDCVAEVMIVSTCNRVEVYAVVDRFHAVVSEVTALLAVHSGVPVEQLVSHLYVHYEDRAVEHLFSVAAGLDSMVVGEGQILGQVRQALRLAQDEGTLGPTLNELVQQALRVGKRSHAETGIDRAGASLVGVGLRLAERALGPIQGLRALVVGAGSMSALSAATLQRAGVTDIVVVNRTHERAVRLAQTVGGRAAEFGGLAAELAGADLVVSCTGATDVVVTADMVTPRRMFLLDLALPHDVDPAVRRLPGVTLVDLESMQNGEIAGVDDDGRAEAVAAVRAIVAEEVAAYLSAERAARVTPTVVALRSKAADVVEAELGRLASRVPEIEGRVRDEVAQTVRRVVDKLLHEPTVRVKQLAASSAGDHYAEALRELFNLDPKVPDAVRRVETIDMEVDR
ncbi:glutamyl-tRNA reductase [Planomonospora parontospora]|uniref:glutamyl-tRNA reductase n=1 Tax=Planomonospora parontospora TaxID=58119 RepID=UPI00166F7207|nr:glutamyl-tRNA reductase [Planomonospora parontospora]GGL36344.1 glutamyl-tRNA reductase [Planomonospora parontospora subsp. antibiotica]GII17380.1 glutamyl-tRNA reductase [Planomonospora parontospora subsp. antibiotica]